MKSFKILSMFIIVFGLSSFSALAAEKELYQKVVMFHVIPAIT